MVKINELLDKYLMGLTTLEEEKELKNYFLSDDVKPEYEIYRAMFETFNFELLESAPTSSRKNKPYRRNVKRFWLQTISFSGIAATLLLVLWFISAQPGEDFAIIRGKRIDNPEYAQQYTRMKFQKVNNLLAKSMKPMESFEIVRSSMNPVHKITETRERIKEIKNKLQY